MPSTTRCSCARGLSSHRTICSSNPRKRARPRSPVEAESVEAELAKVQQAVLGLLKLNTPDLHQRLDAAILTTTYRQCDRNQLETARRLGMSRNVIRARLIEYGELAGTVRRSPESIPPLSLGRRADSGTIRIGYQKLGLLMLVKAYGAFDAALAARGKSVTWAEYEGGIQIVGALRARELDLGIVGNCPAVFAQAEDVPIVYVAAEPPAPRGAALVRAGALAGAERGRAAWQAHRSEPGRAGSLFAPESAGRSGSRRE